MGGIKIKKRKKEGCSFLFIYLYKSELHTKKTKEFQKSKERSGERGEKCGEKACGPAGCMVESKCKQTLSYQGAVLCHHRTISGK